MNNGKNQQQIPTAGLFFDREDVEGELHTRTYYRDGQRVFDGVVKPDPDRPGRWQVAFRWRRRGKWLMHGWGPMEDESAGLALLDAAGVGVEALSDGSVFLGHVIPESKTAPRPSAGETCRANGWGPGTLLMSSRWQAPKPVQAIDPTGAVTLNGPGGRYQVQTFPADVHEVTV